MVSTVAAAPRAAWSRTRACSTLAGDQRSVAGKHEHRSRKDAVGRRQQRVAGSQLLVLQGHDTVGGKIGDHLLVPMAQDHHDPLRVHGARGRQHVEEHGPAAHRVQHLGKLRLHAFALAGGQHDHAGDMRAHSSSHPDGASGGRERSWGGRIRTYASRDQNPLPYRLATPQRFRLRRHTPRERWKYRSAVGEVSRKVGTALGPRPVLAGRADSPRAASRRARSAASSPERHTANSVEPGSAHEHRGGSFVQHRLPGRLEEREKREACRLEVVLQQGRYLLHHRPLRYLPSIPVLARVFSTAFPPPPRAARTRSAPPEHAGRRRYRTRGGVERCSWRKTRTISRTGSDRGSRRSPIPRAIAGRPPTKNGTSAPTVRATARRASASNSGPPASAKAAAPALRAAAASELPPPSPAPMGMPFWIVTVPR